MNDFWLNTAVRSALIRLTSNPVSAMGSALAAGGAVLLVLFALVYAASAESVNPYVGALGFLGLPALIVLGAGLAALGEVLYRGRESQEPFWVSQLNIRDERRALKIFGAATAALVVFLSLSGAQAARFMDSSRFCGRACHSVMEPEAVAHENSPHSFVDCVDCHVGEGARGMVVSKMRGAWQVISLVTNSYERPIPAPVATLPSSEDTCSKCHDTRDEPPRRMRIYHTYGDGEESEKLVSAVVMKVGSSRRGAARGAHAHGSEDLKIRYYTLGRERERIVWTEARGPEGKRVWAMEGEEPPVIRQVRRTSKGRPIYIIEGEGEMREMDCVDCHNRVGHEFLRAGDLADELLDKGVVDPSLPYAKLVILKALEKAAQGPKETARRRVAGEVLAAWPTLPEADRIAATVSAEAEKYLYPRMNIGWGAYESLNRHERDEGCFRCHNQRMKNEKGENLAQSCGYCHDTIADRIPYSEWETRLRPPPKKEAGDGSTDTAPGVGEPPVS